VSWLTPIPENLAALRWMRGCPPSFGTRDAPNKGLQAVVFDLPSCLISCSHRSPEGNLSVFVGRHGAMNPAGRARKRNIMPIVRTIAAHLNPFDCASHAFG
jgi:hypothetical protein